jgi:tRNA(Arg) A34 adenosine deaminase TadA
LDTSASSEERTLSSEDARHLCAAFDVAARARRNGNHPFGALLVAGGGELVLEAENTVTSARDCTGHAETNLMRMASQALSARERRGSTVYTSAEPCPMCAGAIFWANVRRVVFGLGQEQLRAVTGREPDELAIPMSCREVFAHGEHGVEVVGPSLVEQALAAHQGFWG